MYRNFRSQNFYTFLVIMGACIAIIMYCQRLFLFTGKQQCLHKKLFQGTYQNVKFGGFMVLAVQLFNKIKRKKKKTKNMKKHVSLYFTDIMSKYIYLS